MKNSGFKGNRIGDNTGILDQIDSFTQSGLTIPAIDEYHVTDGTFILTGVTGVSAVGQVILVRGSGFTPGATVKLGTYNVPQTVYVNSRTIWFLAPALSMGTYPLIVINSLSRNGAGAGALVPGVSYSAFPAIVTNSNLGNIYEGYPVDIKLQTVLDSTTIFTNAGALPPGVTLDPYTGNLSGTSSVESTSTTYTFTIVARDAQNQESSKTFNLTVNTDAITWNNPTNNATLAYAANTQLTTTLNASSIAGSAISYTATTLPTGLTLSGSVISGTPTTTDTYSTSTTIYATATPSNRTVSNTVTWVIQVGDVYWNHTLFALNAEPEILPFTYDASVNNSELLATNAAQSIVPSTFNPFQSVGQYSIRFNGISSQWISFPSSGASTPGNLGTGDFTVECWVYPLNKILTTPTIFDNANSVNTNRFAIWADPGASASNVYQMYAAGITTSTSTPIVYHKWVHLAAVRSSGVIRMYINGTIDTLASITSSANLAGDGTAFVGGSNNGSSSAGFNGYIYDFRIIRGTAIYTSNFTAPTTTLTTTTDTVLSFAKSSKVKDLSITSATLTIVGATAPSISPSTPFLYSKNSSGSVNFTPNGLVISQSSTVFALGSANFTIELWFFTRAKTEFYPVLVCNGNFGTGKWQLCDRHSSFPTKLTFNVYGASTSAGWITSNVDITDGQWYHAAIVRSGSAFTMYLDGAVVGSATYAGAVDPGTAQILYAGQDASQANTHYTGYMSNLRINKDATTYTGPFTPPTTPLTTSTTTALLTFQTSGPTNNTTFSDDGPFNHVLLTNNNPSRGSFSPFSPSGWSAHFNRATSDYLTTASSSVLSVLDTDFTVECWICQTRDQLQQGLVSASYDTNFHLVSDSGGPVYFFVVGQSINTPSNVIKLNQWTHIAAVRRKTGNSSIYIDGIERASGPLTLTGVPAPVYIGVSSHNLTELFFGHISNVRITKSAVYNGNFTPSVTPLSVLPNTTLLMLNSRTFNDTGPNKILMSASGSPRVTANSPFANSTVYNSTVHGTSIHFPGSVDSIQFPTGGFDARIDRTFTIDVWLYLEGAQSATLLQQNANPSLFYIRITATTIVIGDNSSNLTATYTLPVRQWCHFAVSKNNGTWAIYVDGVRVYNSGGILANSIVDNFTIGATSGGGYFNGYMSGFRFVQGYALYTDATFPLPTAPATAITGTHLLLNSSGAIVDAHASLATRSLYQSNVELSTYRKKFGNASIRFPGVASNCLTIIAGPQMALGYGDFTIEFWVYLYATGAHLLDFRPSGLQGLYPSIYMTGANVMYYTNSADRITGSALSTSTWHHIAVTRSSQSTKMYVNGAQVGGTYTDFNIYTIGATMTIGAAGYDNTVGPLNGYIDNVRITKFARYTTATFVVSTSTFNLR